MFPPQFHILSLYSTPELALIAGNVFSYIISPKTKLFPTLKQKLKITPDSVDFIFSPNQKFAYTPGQYIELTLPHSKTDNRGDRRYFTLASSPTEKDIRFGIKFYKEGSSYKKALLAVNEQTTIVASQVSGDFVLPRDIKQKLVFIAGGIGITPFRSMTKFLVDTKQKRDVTLLYSARTNDDFAYRNLFEEARSEIGLNTIYFVTDEEVRGDNKYLRHQFIDERAIRNEVPDYRKCHFYISGTHPMVKALQEILSNLGVPKHQIKIDYFPGYK
jgi:ferredoxin-NADP reductase